MAKLSIKAGSTKETIDVFIQSSLSSSGGGLTGLTSASGSLTFYYNFPRQASTAVTLAALSAVNSSWLSGGFKEIDATNQPGHYRLDLPDAMLQAGQGRYVKGVLRGAANMVDTPFEIELTGWDNQDGLKGGMTNLQSPSDVAAAVWDELAEPHQNEGTFGLAIGNPQNESDTIYDLVRTNLDRSISSRASQDSMDLANSMLDAKMSSRLAAANYTVPLTSTTILTALGLNGPNLSSILGDIARDAAVAVWDEEIMEHLADGTTGNALMAAQTDGSDLATQTSLDALAAVVAGIAADTANIPDSPATSTDVSDVLVVAEAIQNKTDQLTFTIPNVLDGNVKYVNDYEIGGSGQPGDTFGPA